ATFNRRRAVELKHGRIAMYATIGYIVPEYFRWPGFLSPSLGLKFSDMPNGLAALSKLPVLGGAQIIAFAGLIETTGFFQAASTTDGRGPREGQFSMKDSTESAEPGNYGVGFPNFLGKVEDPEARKTKLAAELANGRLAMMAIIGMFFQDGLTGSAWGDWSTYTASPLRAYDPSEEVGAMPPLGFFDPLNFSKPGRPLGVFLQDLSDEEKFAWLRAAELKNGRVAMMATVGAVFQHFVRLPGFESMPAGIKAIEKAPGSYGFVILWILAGVLELGPWRQVADKAPQEALAHAPAFGTPKGRGRAGSSFRLMLALVQFVHAGLGPEANLHSRPVVLTATGFAVHFARSRRARLGCRLDCLGEEHCSAPGDRRRPEINPFYNQNPHFTTSIPTLQPRTLFSM
ncbi:FCPF, partial [Symbiodinium sp. KB8]